MAKNWVETEISVETHNWRGEPVTITGVKALRDKETGQTRISPYELAQAEISNIAKGYGVSC